MNRIARAWAAATTIAALLFAQLAIAALPCAGTMPAMAGMEQAMPGCEQMDSRSMPLCHHHCEQAAQPLDKAEPPAVAPAALIAGLAPALAAPGLSRARAIPSARFSRALHPPAPPPNTCLRI